MQTNDDWHLRVDAVDSLRLAPTGGTAILGGLSTKALRGRWPTVWPGLESFKASRPPVHHLPLPVRSDHGGSIQNCCCTHACWQAGR
jgi:hypothetical protein